jgi:hypothetical protein
MTRQKTRTKEHIEGPAVITDHHLRNRTIDAGGNKAWSLLTGYEKAYNKGHLLCKELCTNATSRDKELARAHQRFAAARDLDLGWRRCLTPFPGGSDFDRVRSSGGGTQGAFADHARDAKTFWRKVQAEMGRYDWMICRMVCCEGYSVSEAVMTVSPSYKYTTLVRFREALDALADAIQQARLALKPPLED